MSAAKEIAGRIRAAMAERGWTQERLRREAGIASSTMTKLLAGGQALTRARIDAIARCLGMPAATLIGDAELHAFRPGMVVDVYDSAGKVLRQARVLRLVRGCVVTDGRGVNRYTLAGIPWGVAGGCIRPAKEGAT